ISELKYVFRTSDNPYAERYAAWELAQWYLNQATREAARQSLEYVDVAIKKEKDTDFLRRATILKVEAYTFLQDREKGMHILRPLLEKDTHPDLYLAAANLASSNKERIKWMNKALEVTQIDPISLEKYKSLIPYDCLTCDSTRPHQEGIPDQPKVTVIVPVYNGESVIATALESLVKQSWTNLEII